MGLGRCIALPSLREAEYELQGASNHAPIFFSFNRFDAENPKPTDELFQSFPRLLLMLPEIVLIQDETGSYMQLNSLGPVYQGRVNRFVRQTQEAPARMRTTIPYELVDDSLQDWEDAVDKGLHAIKHGDIEKIVLSRRKQLKAKQIFSSKDLLVNLIDGPSHGVVILYRYGDVFFCGCTPELLVRKEGTTAESLCLAGTISAGSNEAQRAKYADELLHDDKNLREHAYVVDFIKQVFARNCYDVSIADKPNILSLEHIQHLYTPIKGSVLEGKSIIDLMQQLHPTPALCGTPIGEAMMLIREIESYNRGFYGGAVGYVDGKGDGEFSVALRTGVFDGEIGWVYAGCGIVDGSVALDEYDEIDMKLKTVLSAFNGD